MRSRPVRLLPLAASWMTLGCSNSSAAPPRIADPAMVPAASASPGNNGPHRFVFGASPGPIAGRWVTTCPYTAGMVVDIKVDKADGKSAVGHIAFLGQGVRRGCIEGDELLHLTADDFGQWVGHLHWRSVAGMDRQDPIRFVATANKLDAIMSTDECYKGMPRAQ
jgi:hypothetical protein